MNVQNLYFTVKELGKGTADVGKAMGEGGAAMGNRFPQLPPSTRTLPGFPNWREQSEAQRRTAHGAGGSDSAAAGALRGRDSQGDADRA